MNWKRLWSSLWRLELLGLAFGSIVWGILDWIWPSSSVTLKPFIIGMVPGTAFIAIMTLVAEKSQSIRDISMEIARAQYMARREELFTALAQQVKDVRPEQRN